MDSPYSEGTQGASSLLRTVFRIVSSPIRMYLPPQWYAEESSWGWGDEQEVTQRRVRDALDSHQGQVRHATQELGVRIFNTVILFLIEAIIVALLQYNNALQLEWEDSYSYVLLVAWGIAALLGAITYYLYYVTPLNRSYKRYLEIFRQFEEAMPVASDEDAMSHRLEQLRKSTGRMLIDNPVRAKAARARIREAEEKLEANDINDVKYLVGEIEELMLREQRELNAQVSWRLGSGLAVVVYTFLLIVFAVVLSRPIDESGAQLDFAKTLILGVPLAVIVWGAAGSLAAILYRFYTQTTRVRWEREFRWLLARPLIGIIMGAAVYVALVAGLFAFGTVGTSLEPANQRPELFWLVAFLAGFSDKFYIGIINLLVDRVAAPSEDDKDGAPPADGAGDGGT